MKKRIKLLIFALAVIMSLPLICSCGEETPAGEQSTEISKIPYNIVEYTVIRPEKASDAVEETAIKFRKYIHNY